MKKLEDIKVGETFNVRATVISIADDRVDVIFNDQDGIMAGLHIVERGTGILRISLPETAPKYDPSRLFRKGDIVEPRKGREVYACEWEDCVFHKLKGTYKVCNDEREGHVSVIDKETGVDCYVSVFALELVTPVEEMERYVIIHNEREMYYEVCWKDDDEGVMTGRVRCRATYWYHQPPQTYSQKEAKAAADAECDRLNAEYRKEKNNG